MNPQAEIDYLKDALAGVVEANTWYIEQIERLAPPPSGHETYGELQGDGSDYCACGHHLGHDFPPEETLRRWVAHRLTMATEIGGDPCGDLQPGDESLPEAIHG